MSMARHDSMPLLALSSTLFVLTLSAGCADEPARPPYALEGSAAGSPCERAGFRCVPGGSTCGQGTVSAGKSLGCPGEAALCCMNTAEAGVRDAGPEASIDASPDGGTDASRDAAAE